MKQTLNKIKKLAEFDAGRIAVLMCKDQGGMMRYVPTTPVDSAKSENARLKPIISALISVIEKQSEALSLYGRKGCGDFWEIIIF